MVQDMEYTVKIDKQGRLTIPSEIRKKLNLTGEKKVTLKVKGNKVIIEFNDPNLEQRVENWYKKMLKSSVKAFTNKEEYLDSKWISDDSVRRKLGIA